MMAPVSVCGLVLLVLCHDGGCVSSLVPLFMLLIDNFDFDRKKRQEVQSIKNMDDSVRNTHRQTVGQMAHETVDEYHNRRYSELKNCPHPTPKDILDADQDPTAALVKFYMKSNLDPRHDPPLALQNNRLVLFGLNIMKWASWSDSVIQVLRSMDTFSRILQEGQELRAAARCIWNLQRCQHHENDTDSLRIDDLTKDKFESELKMYYERIKAWCYIVISNVESMDSEQSGNTCEHGTVGSDDEGDESMHRDTEYIDEDSMSNLIVGHAEFQQYIVKCVFAVQNTSETIVAYQPSILDDTAQSYWIDVELAHGFERTVHLFQTSLALEVDEEENDTMEAEDIEIHKYALDKVMKAAAARRLKIGDKVTSTSEYQHVLHVREQVRIEQNVVLPGDPCCETHLLITGLCSA